jgi:hypothetical protein
VRTLPPKMLQALAPFAPLFSKRVWRHAQVLLMGAILAPGRRTLSSALRTMGLDQERPFHRYHRVLNRASWSSQEVSRVLLGLLVKAFLAELPDPLVVGIDETLERRWGKKIAYTRGSTASLGAFHSYENFVKRASPASTDTLTLRDPSFFHSILLEVGRTPVAKSRVQPADVVEGLQVLEDGRLRCLTGRELHPTHQFGLQR